MSTKKLFSKVLFISFLFLTQFQLLAATHIVNGGMYYFTPSSLTINQGDTVIWINDMGFHDVNFDINSITGQSFGNPVSFQSPATGVVGDTILQYVFDVSGDYQYDCSIGNHASSGMVGSITVNANTGGLAVSLPYDINFDDPTDDGLGAIGPTPTITMPSSGMWTIDVSDASLSASTDWFMVNNGQMEARDVDGDVIWTTAEIDISTVSSVKITMDVSNAGGMESNDYLQVDALLDGNLINLFYEVDDFPASSLNHSLSGNTLQLIVTAYNGAGSEYHRFDNVLVVEDSGLDTSPPSLVSLSIEDSQTIMAISNEALSSSSLVYDGDTILYFFLNSSLDTVTYTLPSSLLAGSHTFDVILTDLAGNSSTTMETLSYAPPGVVIGNTSDLIISEYSEGSSNNKYIEIFNGTGSDVDLSIYEVWKISNGGSWPEDVLTLSGTLLDGDVYIVYNSSSSPDITNLGDVTWGGATFNGDDAIGLAKNGLLIDAVGTDGADPGSGWDVDGISNATANHTLVRKNNVCSPNPTWAETEWEVYDIDTWIYLGSHNLDCSNPGGDVLAPSLVSLSIEDSQTIMAISNEALSSSSLVYDGDTILYFFLNSSLDTVTYTLPSSLLAGSHTFDVILTDLAGNSSTTMETLSYAPPGVVIGNTSDLIISEYSEGSSNNKYIEIFNGTGSDVDLSIYEVWKISNGGSWPEDVLTLSDTLLDGDVYIVYNSSASPDITNLGDWFWSGANFNGDDAIGLAKNGLLIDAVGTDGADPGSGWDVDGVSNATANHTLVRKNTVCSPNPTWTEAEWEVYDIDTWVYLGSHNLDCPDCIPTIEICDGIDNDCDGIVDNNLTDLGSCEECINGAIQSTASVEICDGIDNDCDGLVDNNVTGLGSCEECVAGVIVSTGSLNTYYADLDLDGYGDDTDSQVLCAANPPYTATQGGDCNDMDLNTYPGALEICGDGIDQDCDTQDLLCPTSCNPNSALTVGGIYPPVGSYTLTHCGGSYTAFPDVLAGASYSTYVDFVVPTDTVIMYDVSGNGTPTEVTVTLDSMVVDAVIGLPNGLSFTCNPLGCSFTGGSSACATIEGTTNDPTGIYPLQVVTIAYGNFMNLIYDIQVDTIDSYALVIQGGASIGTTLDGVVTYENGLYTPLSSVTINALDINGNCVNAAITDSNGYYNMPVASGSYTLDVSTSLSWGGVNSTDALSIQNHVIAASTLSGLNEVAIDVNLSGSNTSADALLVRQRFVNIISEFSSGDWAFNPEPVNVVSVDTEDFQGICMGDVNGSYIPNNLKISSVNIQREGNLVFNSKNVSIPITIKNDLTMGALSMVIDFSSPVKDVDVIMGIDGLDQDLLYNFSNNQLRISWMNTNGIALSNGEELFTINLFTSNPQDIELIVTNESELADIKANVIDNVVISYPKLIAGENFISINGYPNPFNDKLMLEYTILNRDLITLVLTDLLGNKLYIKEKGLQEAGIYTHSINTNKLKAGVYFLTLYNGSNISKTIKLIK